MVSAVARLPSLLPAAGSAVLHRGTSCPDPRLSCPCSPSSPSCSTSLTSALAGVRSTCAPHTSLPHIRAGSSRAP
eukprot:4013549-Pleurochrysis_carterae.AAC.1